jgi:hypothetical protein
MKRRELERHLRAEGCQQVDEGGTTRGGWALKARGRWCHAIARSTTDWLARSADNSKSHCHWGRVAISTRLLVSLPENHDHRDVAQRVYLAVAAMGLKMPHNRRNSPR